MSNGSWIQVPVLRVTQPIGNFYVCKGPAPDLAAICKGDIRRIETAQFGGPGKADVFTYMGIQRPLNPDRVKEIRNYVRAIDACFPNTIIMPFHPKT